MDKDSRSLMPTSYFSQLSTKAKELYEKIKEEKNNINPEKFVLVKTDGTIFNFNKFRNWIDLASNIYREKNLLKDVEAIKNRRSNLKNEIKKMSEDKKEIEKPDKILKIVEEVLDFNKKIRKQQGLGVFNTNTKPNA